MHSPSRAPEQRSRLACAVFADAAQRFPEKFGRSHAAALRVKAMADSIVRHIEGVKARCIAQADGVELVRLRGKDDGGRDTLRALMALDNKDGREALTRLLVGPERGAQPIERPVNGALFDADVKTIFSRLRSGDRVIFQGSKARLANAPAGTRTYDLAPISWKVVD